MYMVLYDCILYINRRITTLQVHTAGTLLGKGTEGSNLVVPPRLVDS